MASSERDRAEQWLEAALVEQGRLGERFDAAVGTSSEFGAYVRLRAAGDQVTAREAWLNWVDDEGYRGLNAGPFELLAESRAIEDRKGENDDRHRATFPGNRARTTEGRAAPGHWGPQSWAGSNPAALPGSRPTRRCLDQRQRGRGRGSPALCTSGQAGQLGAGHPCLLRCAQPPIEQPCGTASASRPPACHQEYACKSWPCGQQSRPTSGGTPKREQRAVATHS